MPDTFSISLLMIGFYFGYQFIKSGKWLSIFLFFLFSTFGMLAKIPAASLFAGPAVVLLMRSIPANRRWALAAAAVLSTSIVGLWYFYWVPHLLSTYGIILYDSKGLAEGFVEVVNNWAGLFEKFYFSALHSFVAFACCVAGLWIFFREQIRYWKWAIGITSLVFLIFIFKTGIIFPTHNYYVIPFVPVMALMAGYAISKLPLRFQYIFLILIGIEGIANQQHDFFIKDSQKYKLELEEKLSEVTTPGDLIVINGGPSPQDIYFAHQKGWSMTNQKVLKPTVLDSLNALGAQYLVIDKVKLPNADFERKLLYEDHYYSVYAL